MFAFILVPYLHAASPASSEVSADAPTPVQSPIVAQPLVAPAPRARPTVSIAHGYGNDVPLSFAARQIVPTRVSVGFGPGVDPTRAVTWHGGRPWPQVLADLSAATGTVVRFSPGHVDFLSRGSR